MVNYLVLIIDDSIIGDALVKCIAYFTRDISEYETITIKLFPDKREKSNIFIQIIQLLWSFKNTPVIIFINLKFKTVFEDNAMEIMGLDIAEEIRLFNIPKTIILLYSFESEASLAHTERFSKLMSLQGHIYFSLPFQFKGHFASWIQELENFDLTEGKTEFVYKAIFSTKAEHVSKQFMRDFKHSIVDKMLPQLKVDLNRVRGAMFQYWVKEKIRALFSNEISEFCGIDMKKVFINEKEQIEVNFKKMETSATTRMRREIDSLQILLKSILEKSLNLSRGQNHIINFEIEQQRYYKYITDLKELFNEIWTVDLWELGDNKYMNTWKTLKTKISAYYNLRLNIEIILWRLSIWIFGKYRRTHVDRMLCQFLDLLMERVEYNDFNGASRVFDHDVLRNMNIEKGERFNNIFTEMEL